MEPYFSTWITQCFTFSKGSHSQRTKFKICQKTARVHSEIRRRRDAENGAKERETPFPNRHDKTPSKTAERTANPQHGLLLRRNWNDAGRDGRKELVLRRLQCLRSTRRPGPQPLYDFQRGTFGRLRFLWPAGSAFGRHHGTFREKHQGPRGIREVSSDFREKGCRFERQLRHFREVRVAVLNTQLKILQIVAGINLVCSGNQFVQW